MKAALALIALLTVTLGVTVGRLAYLERKIAQIDREARLTRLLHDDLAWSMRTER